MPADYLFVNATDADIADVTAATATTAAVGLRAVAAVSATSADAALFVDAAGALAILPTAATAAQKKAIAFTLLRSAGVDLGEELNTAAKLGNTNQRDKFKNKQGLQEAVNFFNSVA